VAAGDQPGQRQAHHVVFADDDAMDVLLDAVEELGRPPRLKGPFLHWRSSLEPGCCASAALRKTSRLEAIDARVLRKTCACPRHFGDGL